MRKVNGLSKNRKKKNDDKTKIKNDSTSYQPMHAVSIDLN